MNPLLRTFLDAILMGNPVVMVPVGALLATVVPRSARSSYLPGARIALTVFLTALTGGTIAAALPAQIAPVVFIVVGLGGTGALVGMGELQGRWLGLPQALLAPGLLVGMQLLMAAHQDVSQIVAASAGGALGLFVMFVITGAIRESSRISETSSTFKTNPVVLFSLAVFAVVLTGFLFW